eukprot:tig00000449_g960.t1
MSCCRRQGALELATARPAEAHVAAAGAGAPDIDALHWRARTGAASSRGASGAGPTSPSAAAGRPPWGPGEGACRSAAELATFLRHNHTRVRGEVVSLDDTFFLPP